MNKKIGLKELHLMASQMNWWDFENWVAKELFNKPNTADTSALTDGLFLQAPPQTKNKRNEKTR